MKLIYYKSRYSVTIPAEVVKYLGWKKGGNLYVTTNERNEVVIRPMQAKKTKGSN